MSGNEIVKSYAVALGRGGLKPKKSEGDRRTPEGLYRIDSRNPEQPVSPGLAHLLSGRSRQRTRPQARSGPRQRHHDPRPGKPVQAAGNAQHLYDWTDGCIAVTDSEIEEIWRLVPDGTPVEIRP